MKRKTIKTYLACLFVCAIAGGCLSIPDRETVSPTHFKNMSQVGPRSSMEQINFVKLRMDKPAVELLGPNDVLGIYIAGITGPMDEAPPIHNIDKITDEAPASGYPFTVRADGTISLPMLPEPIYVEGMSLIKAEEAIRTAYTFERKMLNTDTNITVSLIKRRTYHVTVIREDVTSDDMRSSGSAALQGKGAAYLGSMSRGTAIALELPAYRNDLLEALSRSGGLPGLNAKNEVIILRKFYSETFGNSDYMGKDMNAAFASSSVADRYNENGEIISSNSELGIVRIPLRVEANEKPPLLSSEDVTLYDGDVVYIQSRDAEIFYTGGLLKGGVYPIPRDYDLDVLGAIATAGGTVGASAGGSSYGTAHGISALLPPSRVLVLREINGRQYAIKIIQKELLRNPNQRILIEPNDVVLVEYTPAELIFNMLFSTISIRINPADWK